MSRNFELLRQAENERLHSTPRATFPIERAPAVPRRVGNVLSPDTENIWSDYYRGLNVLRRHWRLSALFFVIVFLTVVLVTFLQRPIYEPTARIEIEPPGTEIVSLQGGGSGVTDAEYEETQAQNLQSDELGLAIIRALHLDQNTDIVGKDNRSPVLPKSGAQVNALELSPAENAALRTFQKRLKVKRDTASRLINVSFASHDPVLAAQVTNTLLSQFIERTYQTRHDAILQSSEWVAKQLDDIRDKMERSNRELAEYQRASGIADIDDKQSTVSQRLAELNKQLSDAQGDRIQYEAYLNRIRSGSGESLPQVRDNPVIQGLTQKQAEVRGELSQALVVYGKNNPNAKRPQSQSDELQKELSTQRKFIISGIQTSYAAAQTRERLIQQELKGTTDEANRLGQYNALKKEAQTNTDLYNSLYSRVKEAGIAAASKSSNVRVVDTARVLDEPTRPRVLLNLAFGFLLGLVGGIGVAFIKDGLDSTVRSLSEVTKYTGISAVAIVPRIQSGGSVKALGNGHLLLRSERSNLNGGGGKFLLQRPRSPESEAIRHLHTSIMLSRMSKPPQAMLILSSLPGEGKTLIAVNLAMSLARDARTCLIDCDLRRPGIHKVFGLSRQQGLTDLLSGNALLEDLLVTDPEQPNLSILVGGTIGQDPIHLVDSQPMQQLLQQLRQKYEFIVIDSAPIIPFADGLALAPLVDGIVLVGRYGVTSGEALRRSVELLEEVHAAPVLQVVLNATESSAQDSYQYSYSSYS
jgi:polysaccharide biosynthesis transport protein